MIAVIFEVLPSAAGRQTYLDTAAALRARLESMDGFISVERFESLSQPGKMLSLSFWRDEAAVSGWRALPAHRKAQAAGRAGVFADYRKIHACNTATRYNAWLCWQYPVGQY